MIDGTKIVFKPRVQTSPLLDLDTIRGTFKLTTSPGNWHPRALAVTGTRDTVSKTETGEWRILYEVTETRLTLLLTPRGSDWPASLTERDEKDYKFVLRRVPEKGQSAWGEPAEGLRTRVSVGKTTFALDEGVEIALDVKAEAGPNNWVAGRDAQLARVEINGVWYAPQHNAMYYIPPSDLAAGSEVSRWVVVRLGRTG